MTTEDIGKLIEEYRDVSERIKCLRTQLNTSAKSLSELAASARRFPNDVEIKDDRIVLLRAEIRSVPFGALRDMAEIWEDLLDATSQEDSLWKQIENAGLTDMLTRSGNIVSGRGHVL